MMFTKNVLSFLTAFLILTASTHVASAMPFYDVQAGKLVSIENIDVNGTAYDVAFRDGVLQDIFNLASPFTFTTGSDANDASLALLLAMADVPEGDFDTNPLLTEGCAGDNCVIYTPYLFDFGFVSTEWFRNAALEVDDERGGADLLPTLDSTGQAFVYADWRPHQDAPFIPEPSTMLLVGGGLLGNTLLRRKKR